MFFLNKNVSTQNISDIFAQLQYFEGFLKNIVPIIGTPHLVKSIFINETELGIEIDPDLVQQYR